MLKVFLVLDSLHKTPSANTIILGSQMASAFFRIFSTENLESSEIFPTLRVKLCLIAMLKGHISPVLLPIPTFLVVLKRKGYPELSASMDSMNLALHENI